MPRPVRGEFWRAQLNLNPEDPGYLKSAQIRAAGRYTLVISRDDYNEAEDTATVVPRTRHMGSILGGVTSPRGDGGCGDEATIDCCQIYSLWQADLATDAGESRLSEPIQRGRISNVMSEVDRSLRTYFSQHQGQGYLELVAKKGAILDHRGNNPQGLVVLAQWESYGPCECVVVSNSTMNARRPLPLLTVIPSVPTRDLPVGEVPDPIVLRAEEDNVSEDCIALFEQPYTIDPRFHVTRRLGRVRPNLLMQILGRLEAHLHLPVNKEPPPPPSNGCSDTRRSR